MIYKQWYHSADFQSPPLVVSTLFWSTCEHSFNTSSLNLKNPSLTLGSFSGNDRKWVKGCFLRKLSTRTSTRVITEETEALCEPVITFQSKRGRWWCNHVLNLTPVWKSSDFLTNLSLHSLFWDADRCFCVRFQASTCFSLFPNDVSVNKKMHKKLVSLMRLWQKAINVL